MSVFSTCTTVDVGRVLLFVPYFKKNKNKKTKQNHSYFFKFS